MATFNVDTDRLIASSGEIAGLAVKMNSICAALEGVQLESAIESSNLQRFRESLKSAADDALTEAAKMRTLSSALQTIAVQYRKTEEELAGVLAGTVGSAAGVTTLAGGTLGSQLAVMIQTWIKNKQQELLTFTTLRQEQAADEAMRARLRETLQDEKYSQETWEKASVEERKQILQDYMNEVVDIYGLEQVNPEIQWEAMESTDTGTTIGYYFDGDKTVTLNELVLSDSIATSDSYDLLNTVSHELRHAYQHEAIQNPSAFTVSPATIAVWKINDFGYINADALSSLGVDPTLSFDLYYNQPLEVDARSFEI